MSVGITTARSGPYIPNGVTVAFPFDFHAASINEIRVVIDDATVSLVDYEIEISDDQDNTPGGTVTFAVAPTGTELWVESDPLFNQQDDFGNAGAFLLEVIGDALDRSVLRDIKLKDAVDRAVVAPPGTTPVDYQSLLDGITGDPGADVTDMGLLADAEAATIPDEIIRVSTRGRSATDVGGAKYVAGTAPSDRAGFTSANSRNFVLSKEQVIVPQIFYEATDPDYQNAMQKTVDYLKTQDYNANGGDYYGSSQTLMVPAGPALPMHDYLDVRHTFKLKGEASSQTGPGSSGASCLAWVAGTGGLRIQHPATEGVTTYVPAGNLQGSGGFVMEDMCLKGGFNGTTEGDFHGLNIRSAAKILRSYIKDWPGEAIHAWAGVVTGVGNVGGNVSTLLIDSTKTESCRGGIDIQGSDANVCSTINSEVYLNRQFGYRDANGAGANGVMMMHAATNGQVTGPWAQTQTSYGGNRYALRPGGDPTVAPSGTTANTVNWAYMQAGGAIANTIPAWTATPGIFREGGDYMTLGSAGVLVSQSYSEGGGFSFFNQTTLITHSAIGDHMYLGGHRIIPQSGGLSITTDNLIINPPPGSPTGGALVGRGPVHTLGNSDADGNNTITLDLDSINGDATVNFRKSGGTVVGYFNIIDGNGFYANAPAANGWNFRVGGNAIASIISTGLDIAAGKKLSIGGTQILGSGSITTPDATDLASAIALSNAIKAKMNT